MVGQWWLMMDGDVHDGNFLFVYFFQAEFALPEQYKSTWNGKGFTTVPTEST
jgi:hypothetical protein